MIRDITGPLRGGAEGSLPGDLIGQPTWQPQAISWPGVGPPSRCPVTWGSGPLAVQDVVALPVVLRGRGALL